jgi:hypothetical protein
MESYRKTWNKQQTKFKDILLSFDQHDKAISMFLGQHARLHSAAMTDSVAWSFEDEIMDNIQDQTARLVPINEEHSIAWLFWHIARIEDVTMNLLVAGKSQILYRENWLDRMKISIVNTGNGMKSDELTHLSETIDIETLRKYRQAVGRQTQQIVMALHPDDLKEMVDQSRLRRVKAEGAVLANSTGLIDYWGRKNIAGLLLMPPTRHCFVHLNEAARVKKRAVR